MVRVYVGRNKCLWDLGRSIFSLNYFLKHLQSYQEIESWIATGGRNYAKSNQNSPPLPSPHYVASVSAENLATGVGWLGCQGLLKSSPELDSWHCVSQTRPRAAQILEVGMEMPVPDGKNCKATSQGCAYQERSRIEDTFAISTSNTSICLVPIYL